MKNSLKLKLKNNQPTIGSWITLGHTSIVEIMAQAGFDWLTIDLEHSVITLDVAQQLIQVIESNGIVPLVRVEENNPTIIKRVMDAGAYGVIVPMVNSKEDAERAVKATKYPSMGHRGVGLARAQGYGAGFEEYASTINNESVVIVQVEHIDSVRNLDSILAVEGVDGCIIGPYDISGSLGVPGDFENPNVLKAIEKVEKICLHKNFPLGMHVIQPDYKQVLRKIARGYTFLAFSLDILFLGNSIRTEMEGLRSKMKS